MLLSTTILIVIVLIPSYYFYKFIQAINNAYYINSKLPGPKGKNYFIGNLNYLQTTRDNILQRLFEANKTYYPIYKFYAFRRVGVNILTPEDAELVLSNSIHNGKADIYWLLHNWLRFGLLTSKDEKWHSRRRILTPAFHFNILQDFITIFNEESHNLVQTLKDECKKPFTNISQLVSNFTLKTIAETAMGTKLTFQSKKERNYKNAVYSMGNILVYRILHPWFISNITNLLSPRYLKERAILKVLHGFTREVIQNREKTFKSDEIKEHDVYRGKKRLAMLDLLIQAKKDGLIDDSGIQEEVDTFMFEGHDTTAAALGFTFMLLACHREAQTAIRKEMEGILGDVHKKPLYNDLQHMKYLERCIKESLRLYPSVFFIGRKSGTELTTHTGYLVAKGTEMIVHIYSIHRNPEIYPQPEKFDPDRFLPENIQKRHPFAYLPFSAGPRNCIGQKFAILELKVVICAVLANFVLEPIDTPDTINLMADIVLRTSKPIKVKLVPRS